MVVAIHSQKNKGWGWEAVQSVKSTHCASTRTGGQSPAPQRSCVWLCVTPAVMARGSQSSCGKVLWISVASQLSWKGKSLASGSLNPFVKESRVVIETEHLTFSDLHMHTQNSFKEIIFITGVFFILSRACL